MDKNVEIFPQLQTINNIQIYSASHVMEDTDQCCNETSLHTHYGCCFSIHLVLFFGSLCIMNFNPSHSLLPCLTLIPSHTETLLLSNKTLVYIEVLGTAYNAQV